MKRKQRVSSNEARQRTFFLKCDAVIGSVSGVVQGFGGSVSVVGGGDAVGGGRHGHDAAVSVREGLRREGSTIL